MTIYNLISLVGLGVLMFAGWCISRSHRLVNWRVIIWATFFQLAFAAFVFQVPAGRYGLWRASQGMVKLIEAGNAGGKFLFGPLAEPEGEKSLGFVLAFQGFPAIIFFSSLMAMLYYLRIMPMIVRAFGWVFAKSMRVSGAESLYTASQIFSGVESATVIRPYLLKMTDSELHCLMTAGLSTVATNMLVVYVSLLGDVFADVAGHLICASVLGAPAALVAAKLVWPETDEPETLGRVPPVHLSENDSLTAAVINGAMDGVKLCVGIVALLIAFLGLLELVNAILNWLAGANLEELLGYFFRPFSLIMGVPIDDAGKIAELLGLRVVATEVPSYAQLGEWIGSGTIVHQRSALIAVYALCGFTHVASAAIYVGGTAALVPERRSGLARVAFRALLAGTLASLMTGAVAGACYTSQNVFVAAQP